MARYRHSAAYSRLSSRLLFRRGLSPRLRDACRHPRRRSTYHSDCAACVPDRRIPLSRQRAAHHATSFAPRAPRSCAEQDNHHANAEIGPIDPRREAFFPTWPPRRPMRGTNWPAFGCAIARMVPSGPSRGTTAGYAVERLGDHRVSMCAQPVSDGDDGRRYFIAEAALPTANPNGWQASLARST